MNYAKPEVNLLANAVRAIQDPTNKDKAQVLDAAYPINMEPASAAAYAADE